MFLNEGLANRRNPAWYLSNKVTSGEEPGPFQMKTFKTAEAHRFYQAHRR